MRGVSATTPCFHAGFRQLMLNDYMTFVTATLSLLFPLPSLFLFLFCLYYSLRRVQIWIETHTEEDGFRKMSKTGNIMGESGIRLWG